MLNSKEMIVNCRLALFTTLFLLSLESFAQHFPSENRNVLIVIDNELRGKLSTIKDLETLAPAEKIERVNVLKDSAATARYGWLTNEAVIEIYLKNENIFQPVEIEAKFPGGAMAWQLYVDKKLNPSVVTNNGVAPGDYKTEVQFTISAEGKLSDFKPVSTNGFGMEEELIRILKLSPDWIPCLQNGRNVRSFKKLSVNFNVADKNVVNDLNLNDTTVYKEVEIPASFPGGDTAWRSFMIKNMNLTVAVDNGAPDRIYKVIIGFIVDKQGNISELKSLTNYGYGMEKEVTDLLLKSPNWIPAMHNGKVVRSYHKQTVTFKVESEHP